MEARVNLMDNPAIASNLRHLATAGRLPDGVIPAATQELCRLRASQINGCGFCADMHYKEAAHAGEDALRLNLVATWREATVFSEAERAALELTEQGTRLADAAEGVSDETWAHVRKHYDDDETAALVSLVAMINATNRLGVILNYQGGSYQPGQFDAALSD